MIVVDLTLRYKGYVSDATRTFAIGKVSNEEKNVYEIVKESQKALLNQKLIAKKLMMHAERLLMNLVTENILFIQQDME